MIRLLLGTAIGAVCVSLLGCGGGAGGSGTGGAAAGTAGTGGAPAGTAGTGGAAGTGGSIGRGGSGGGTAGAGPGGSGGAPAGGCAAAIDGGRWHQCATKADATLWCWGRNNSGQLGDGTMVDTPRPVQVTGLGASVAQPSAGDSHTCARKTDGTVWCWGSNGSGQLGDGTMMNRTSPVQVTSLGATAVEVSAGSGFTCARKADGTLWCWGSNGAGALGDGTTTDSPSPVQVTALGNGVAEVAAGGFGACARKTDNSLWCWGRNDSGQLGDDTMTGHPTPAQVTALGNGVAHVAVGYENVCVRKTDGTAWCWGRNDFGGVGDGTKTDRLSPTLVPALGTDAIQFSLHEAHACARKIDGTIWCWGDSHYGSLGEPEGTDDRTTPIQVRGWPGMAVELTTGRYHSCARLGDGTVWCWGFDTDGELGAGSISTQPCYETTNFCRPAPGPVTFACP